MKILLSILFTLCSLYVGAQKYPFTVKVVEEGTQAPIQGAIVYVDELHYEDTETDIQGIAYFSAVPEGKIIINARKSGFKPTRQNFNVVQNTKINTITINLQKVLPEDKTHTPIINAPNAQIVTQGQIGDNTINNTNLPNTKFYNIEWQLNNKKVDLLEKYRNEDNVKVSSLGIGQDSLYLNVINFSYGRDIPANKMSMVIKRKDIILGELNCEGVMFMNISFIIENPIEYRGFYCLSCERPQNNVYKIHLYSKNPILDISKEIEPIVQ